MSKEWTVTVTFKVTGERDAAMNMFSDAMSEVMIFSDNAITFKLPFENDFGVDDKD